MAVQRLRVFISHSHEDSVFCRELVAGLRKTGADVWYDEHNMGSGRLSPTIERQLRDRPIFIVILSPAALRSHWVEDEARWAYALKRKDPSRVIQPVTAAPLKEDDIWLFLHDFRRIEDSEFRPFPAHQAVARLLRVLMSTITEEAVSSNVPFVGSNAHELIKQGTALLEQEQAAEALPLLERATRVDPQSFYAWSMLGTALCSLGRPLHALLAFDRAHVIEPADREVLFCKGVALRKLHRQEEAIVVFDRALAWAHWETMYGRSKGSLLYVVGRYDVALATYNDALWGQRRSFQLETSRAKVLVELGRYEEALAAYDTLLDHTDHIFDAVELLAIWHWKSHLLRRMGRFEEALALHEQQIAYLTGTKGYLSPHPADIAEAWCQKAQVLVDLDRLEDAVDAYQEALKSFNQMTEGDNEELWLARGNALHALARIVQELGNTLAEFSRYTSSKAMDNIHRAVRARYRVKSAHQRNEEARAHYDEARAAYSHALALNPDHPAVWVACGNLLLDLADCNHVRGPYGCYDYAYGDYQHIVRGGYDDDTEYHKRICDEVLDAYEHALALAPSNAEAWFGKGVALGYLHRYEEESERCRAALTACDDVLAIDPRNALAWVDRARLLHRLGDALCNWHEDPDEVYEESIECYDKALIALDHAIALDSNLAMAWVERASVLRHLELYDTAIEAYEHAVKLAPAKHENRLIRQIHTEKFESELEKYGDGDFGEDPEDQYPSPGEYLSWLNEPTR